VSWRIVFTKQAQKDAKKLSIIINEIGLNEVSRKYISAQTPPEVSSSQSARVHSKSRQNTCLLSLLEKFLYCIRGAKDPHFSPEAISF